MYQKLAERLLIGTLGDLHLPSSLGPHLIWRGVEGIRDHALRNDA